MVYLLAIVPYAQLCVKIVQRKVLVLLIRKLRKVGFYKSYRVQSSAHKHTHTHTLLSRSVSMADGCRKLSFQNISCC